MSGSISSPAETEKWALDPLGNWTTYQFDGDGDGNFTSAADIDDARSYDSPAGLANEITEWDPYPANSQNSPVEPVYDAAGNMTDDNYQYVYTYDAWNRLVKVEDQGMTPAVVGVYGYDGLNRRITRTIGTDDPIHEYYTESWQRIESRPGGESSTTGVSLYVFGIRYIDDIVMRQRDANGTGPAEERRYYLTDSNYNVSMIVTDAGYGVERVFYTAYGEPEVFPFGDADGDYLVDGTDQSLIEDIKDSLAPYNILADLNLDGAVTQADLNAFSAYSGALGGRNVLAASNGSATTGNDIGYAGYTWNDERSQWHVRHREYDPKLGRWLQRDPVGYADGWNMALYVRGKPLHATDPSGEVIAECLIGGGIGAVGGAIGGYLTSWTRRGAACGAAGGAIAGCCTTVACELSAGAGCVIAGCICGGIANLVTELCNKGLDVLNDPCVLYTSLSGILVGCWSGGATLVNDQKIKDLVLEIVAFFFGMDVGMLGGLCEGLGNVFGGGSPANGDQRSPSPDGAEPLPDEHFASEGSNTTCPTYAAPQPPVRSGDGPPPYAWGGMQDPPSFWHFSPNYKPRNIVPSLPPSLPPRG